MKICEVEEASLSDIVHSNCAGVFPVEIMTKTSLHPQGILTMSLPSASGITCCIWKFKDGDIYEKVTSLFIRSEKVACIIGELSFLMKLISTEEKP